MLDESVEYLAWIKSMLDTSQVTSGYGTGKNTFSFGFYKFLKIKRKRSDDRPMIQPQYDSESLREHSEGSSPD